MIHYGAPVKLPGRNRYYSRTYCRETGRRSWECTGFDTKDEAKTWVETQNMREALGPERTKTRDRAEVTFKQAADLWLEAKDGTVSGERFRNYKARVEKFWGRALGSIRLRDVDAKDITRYLKRRRTRTRGMGKKRRVIRLAAATLNDDRTNLSTFFGWCVRQGWIERNPMLGVEKFSGEARRRTRSLSVEEETALLEACGVTYRVEVSARRNKGGRRGGKRTKDKQKFSQSFTPPPWLRPLVTVAMRSGLRRGTLLAATWANVDLARGVWRLPGELLKTKEDYSAPILAAGLEALKGWRSLLLEEEGPAAVAPEARVFPVERLSVGRVFRRAAKRAGLKVSFHDLRRHFINDCRRRGIGLETTMRLSGHRSVQTLLKHYREVGDEELRAAVDALNGKPTSQHEQA